jgi:enolase
MYEINDIKAYEILDSRGRPTLLTRCELKGGITAQASVPSGASTGIHEAHELRDGDPKRFRGLGCLNAVDHVNTEIKNTVINKTFTNQSELDQTLIDLDGTEQKSRLGANAILSVSIAFARAASLQDSIPLYQYFAKLINTKESSLPRLTINLFSGGKHAGFQVPIQDVLVVPINTKTVRESLELIYNVYQTAADLCLKKYNMRLLTADEGGLAPPFSSADEMLSLAVESVETAGYQPGSDVALAVDVASSHFYHDGKYKIGEKNLTGIEMIDYLAGWIDTYPIVSLEDGLAEEDWEHWSLLYQRIGKRCLVLGDDLLCTNPKRIQHAVALNAANALLLKVNQIGTLTQAAEALQTARSAGWQVTVSARSGETEDDWLGDLAVGFGGNQIKVGSITQSERLAKYNRLLVIEEETKLPVISWK